MFQKILKLETKMHSFFNRNNALQTIVIFGALALSNAFIIRAFSNLEESTGLQSVLLFATMAINSTTLFTSLLALILVLIALVFKINNESSISESDFNDSTMKNIKFLSLITGVPLLTFTVLSAISFSTTQDTETVYIKVNQDKIQEVINGKYDIAANFFGVTLKTEDLNTLKKSAKVILSNISENKKSEHLINADVYYSTIYPNINTFQEKKALIESTLLQAIKTNQKFAFIDYKYDPIIIKAKSAISLTDIESFKQFKTTKIVTTIQVIISILLLVLAVFISRPIPLKGKII